MKAKIRIEPTSYLGPQRIRPNNCVTPEPGYMERVGRNSVCPHGWLVWPNYWATNDGVVHGAEGCVPGPAR